jgi:hypothetical protein
MKTRFLLICLGFQAISFLVTCPKPEQKMLIYNTPTGEDLEQPSSRMEM